VTVFLIRLSAVAVQHVCVQNNSDVKPGRRNRRELPVLVDRPRPQPRLPSCSEGLFSFDLSRQEHDQEVCTTVDCFI